MQHEKVVIIGSGPAGFTAGLYTARANLSPLIIAGDQIGGQVSLTYEVENYPGFPEGVSGIEMVDKFQKQAEKFGARILYELATEVDFRKGSPFTIKTASETYTADTVIITTGASARRLEVPGEEALIGRGVSYCATCDGFFFRGKDVVVVGGGDSALEEGLFLTRYANNVKIIHRRDELRAGQILQDRALGNEKISFIWDTIVDEVKGSEVVEAVGLRNLKTGQTNQLSTQGVFVFVGHFPNTGIFKGQLEMDSHDYLITDKLYQTSVEGVYAAGEAQDPVFKQVATSVGQGCSAAMSAIRWLEQHEGETSKAVSS
jgi:thioredoxin reductase (NADPH)